MESEIEQAITRITQAIDNLNQAFDRHAGDLKEAGDPDGFQQWMTACQAMRDSGNIYLTWAQHYARKSGPPGASDDENEGFLNEGAMPDEGYLAPH